MHQNDPDAFEGLYKKCSGYVSFVCLKFCDSKEDAEEVVQDTFVIAFKKATQLRSDTLLAYLRKIAVRECFRRRKANGQRLANLSCVSEMPDALPELDKALLPEDALLDKERQTQLLVEISKLPKTQREVVYLYYFMDFTVLQIAELMECSVNSVYMVLKRARKSIKCKLEEGRSTIVSANALVLLPLAALFMAEEAAYVATYTPVAYTGVGAAAVVTGAAAGSGSIAGYVTAACAAVVLMVSVNVYVSLSATQDPPPVYEPPAVVEATIQPPTLPPTPAPTPPPALSPTIPPTQPEVPAPTQAPTLPLTSPPTPLPTPAPTQPPPPTSTPAPTQPPPRQPINRTEAVLAALSQAQTPESVAHILDYYGFAANMRLSTLVGEQLAFYLFNEGSGDVLVGIASHTDGSGWRMQYLFNEGGYVEKDTMELFDWMTR